MQRLNECQSQRWKRERTDSHAAECSKAAYLGLN